RDVCSSCSVQNRLRLQAGSVPRKDQPSIKADPLATASGSETTSKPVSIRHRPESKFRLYSSRARKPERQPVPQTRVAHLNVASEFLFPSARRIPPAWFLLS